MPCPRLQALILLSTLAGCAEGVIGDDPVASFGTFAETGVETMMPMAEGQRWCADLPNPVGCDDPGGGDQPNPWVCSDGDLVQINNPIGGGDPRGCACANPELNAELTALISGGEAVVDDSEPVLLKLFRDEVYEDAEEACETLALGQLSIPPDFHNCEYAVAQHLGSNPGDFPPLYKEGTVGDCTAPGNFQDDTTGAGMENLPGDSYTQYYSLGTAIVWSSGSQKYFIDEDFFFDMIDNPGWLFEDGTRVVWTGSEYALAGVSTGTIAHALGLQNSDKPQTINGWSVTTIEGMLRAHNQLLTLGTTQFAFVVNRGGSNVTINYELR